MPAHLILLALITSILRSEVLTLRSRSHWLFYLRYVLSSVTPILGAWVRIPSGHGMRLFCVAIGLCGGLISVQGLQGFRKPKNGRPWSALAFVPYKKRKWCSSLLCGCISNCICFRQYNFYRGTLCADYLIHVSAFRPLSSMHIHCWFHC
jgi:hypothetical protein